MWQTRAAERRRTGAHAYRLARTGAHWYTLNQVQGQAALDQALDAAHDFQSGASAWWGEAQAVREGTIGSEADLMEAELVTTRLESARVRSWALRKAGADWGQVDKARTRSNFYSRRCRQHTRAKVASGSWICARSQSPGPRSTRRKRAGWLPRVADPALRAWGWREIAGMTGRAESIWQPLKRHARLRTPGAALALGRHCSSIAPE